MAADAECLTHNIRNPDSILRFPTGSQLSALWLFPSTGGVFHFVENHLVAMKEPSFSH
ncbi:hypothetical protein X777_03545 [Ooceraea biroi]|uniref:Uncharacterized protein n=1 Tax=Ooceraea biroi TaxID=2015173 RepID=A0A026WJS6_OOCBI|nr:hypothetical protein X777_03545 [Ooceraea biroi]